LIRNSSRRDPSARAPAPNSGHERQNDRSARGHRLRRHRPRRGPTGRSGGRPGQRARRRRRRGRRRRRPRTGQGVRDPHLRGPRQARAPARHRRRAARGRRDRRGALAPASRGRLLGPGPPRHGGAAAALSRPVAEPSWALPSLGGTAAGALALRPLYRRPRDAAAPGRVVDRRGVLIALGGAGLAGVLGRRLGGAADVEQARDAVELPEPVSVGPAGQGLDIDGLTPYLTPNADFYRVDTALVLPRVLPEDYRLRVTGRVARPLELSYEDLLDRGLVEREFTLSCVSNEVGGTLAGNARWLGASLADLLDEAGPEPGADQVVSRSADGWTAGTPTAVCLDGRDALLAVGMNGEPLPLEHGFPVRMVVPGLYGYVSATKWLIELELSSFADFDAYWARRDWAAEAPVKTFSRIDTPKPLANVAAGPVAVAGVAWAQHRGIARVEVRVDEGPWQEAELAPVIGDDTWRQWQWTWEAAPGRRKLEVRATDGDGDTQTEERRTPFPDGATGWHSVVVTAA